MAETEKPIVFHGDALDAIRGFPANARRDAGFQIGRVQNGLEPNDWKPMKSIGGGAREIRVQDETGAYRVIYVANLADAVHVLHAFQKKSAATPKRDIDLARTRFKELMRSPR